MAKFFHYPPFPTMSRFVAPWDTCGWYAGREALQVGARLYTNADAQVTSIPAGYLGADYVCMFDSQSQGFDDKQEVCFRVERDAIVGVAFPEGVPHPDWLKDFTPSADMLGTTLGNWPIFERRYDADALVMIPGYEGAGHHYFPMVRPVDPAQDKALPAHAWQPIATPAYPHALYRTYVTEAFLTDHALDPFHCNGCTLVDGGVAIAGQLIFPYSPSTARQVLKTAFTLKDAAVRLCYVDADGKELSAMEADGSAATDASEVALTLIRDSAAATTTRWLDSRVTAADVPAAAGTPAAIVVKALRGTPVMKHISLCDDTEVYAVQDEMTAISPAAQTLSGSMTLKPFPFDDDHSLALIADNTPAALQYAFPAMDGVFTLETKIRCETSAYCEVPILLDENGTPLMRIAIWHNNLFVTDGGEWKRMVTGVTDWQYYPCGNWLLINLKVDLRRSTYSLFVDGALRAEHFALEHAASRVSSVGFTADAGSELFINRIRIYDDVDFTRALLPAGPVFNVADFGAKGDGMTMDTAAIQRTVEEAAKVGGTVLLKDGTFLTGEVALRSNITLWVDRTAVLLGSQDHGDYPLHTPRNSLCVHRQLSRGLIYGEDVHNVRITGGGMIDGNGLYRFKENDPLHDRLALGRPCMIYITYSSDLTIENIHLRRSCFWTIVPLSTRNVVMRHLDLDCMYTPNRDGIDPVDVCDMSIYDCAIMAGDDGLCFKTSDTYGCERIAVNDLMIQSLASGIKFGTDTYYSLKDAVIAGCTIKNVNRCGVSLEAVDGAQVERVRFERIDMVDVGAPVYIVTGNRCRVPMGGAPERISHIDGVTFSKLRFEKAYPFSFSTWIHEIMVMGQSEEQAIRNVTFEDCTFTLPGGCTQLPGCPNAIDKHYPEYDQHGMSAGSVFTTRYAQNFTVKNLNVTFEQKDVRPQIVHFHTVD